MKIEKIGKVSTESVHKHTKKHWDEWIRILDKNGAGNWERKAIVAFLKTKYKLTPWWQQGVTMGFEIFIGKKVEGRNAKGEYATVASKTFPLDVAGLWKLLTSPDGQAAWLKVFEPIRFEKGESFEAEGEVFGEIRTMLAKRRVRLAYQETDWLKPSIVQVTLVKRPGSKSILVFQHEGLKDGRLKIRMKERWKQALEDLHAMAH